MKNLRIGRMYEFVQAALIGFIDDVQHISYDDYHTAVSLYKTNHNTYLYKRDLQSILQTVWSSISLEEIESVCSHLETNGIIRRVKNQVWKVNRTKREPPIQKFYKAQDRELGKKHVQKLKPGVCSKCGNRVSNTNRHNNKLHTKSECQNNIVKSIINS